jgi:hypothetical protein
VTVSGIPLLPPSTKVDDTPVESANSLSGHGGLGLNGLLLSVSLAHIWAMAAILDAICRPFL